MLALLALLQQVPEEGPWTPYGIDKPQFRAVREVFAGLGQPLEPQECAEVEAALDPKGQGAVAFEAFTQFWSQ